MIEFATKFEHTHISGHLRPIRWRRRSFFDELREPSRILDRGPPSSRIWIAREPKQTADRWTGVRLRKRDTSSVYAQHFVKSWLCCCSSDLPFSARLSLFVHSLCLLPRSRIYVLTSSWIFKLPSQQIRFDGHKFFLIILSVVGVPLFPQIGLFIYHGCNRHDCWKLWKV